MFYHELGGIKNHQGFSYTSPKTIFMCVFRYLFGESVDGTAYVVFGVIAENQKKSLAGSLQRILVCCYNIFTFLSHHINVLNNDNKMVILNRCLIFSMVPGNVWL